MSETSTPQSTSAKTNQLSTITGFENILKKYETNVASLLHEKYGITPKEFMVSAVNAVKKNPQLLQCNPASLFGAVLLSAELGLRFNTPEGHAYILPYGQEAQFILGYKGLKEIMYRVPRVRSVSGEAVFERDTFKYGYGLNPFLEHIPFRGGDRGKLVATYAVVKLEGADALFTVVEKSELDKIQSLSQSANNKYSPYNSGNDPHHFMQIKAAIKKISKFVPTTYALLAKAIDVDGKSEIGGFPRMSTDDNGFVDVEIVTNQQIEKGQSNKDAISFTNAVPEHIEQKSNFVDDSQNKELINQQTEKRNVGRPPKSAQSEMPLS